MKLEIRVGVDFGKLARDMPKIINKHLQRVSRSAEEGSKANIESGLSPKLKTSTIERRKRRGTGGTKPLFETGGLYRSIKGTSEGLQMFEYGKFHHDGHSSGHFPPRPFIDVSKKAIMPVFDKFKKDMHASLNRKSPLVLKA
tara:strand:- start:14 stop:439 length:426 start_codon:yes stop_codon:yes gene_type:complete